MVKPKFSMDTLKNKINNAVHLEKEQKCSFHFWQLFI